MKILEVIESKRWINRSTGQTASIYGAVPWFRHEDRDLWEMETIGFTWRLDNGTIGLGRVPAKTRDEAEAIMKQFNERF